MGSYVVQQSHPLPLSNGRHLVPGEIVDLEDGDELVKAYVEFGALYRKPDEPEVDVAETPIPRSTRTRETPSQES